VSTYVAIANYLVGAVEECRAPPFTSRIVKNVIMTYPHFSLLREVVSTKGKFKPIMITPLIDSEGHALYSTYEPGGVYLPIKLRPNEEYTVKIGVATDNHDVIEELAMLDGVFKTEYGRFIFRVGTVEVTSIDALTFDFGRYFKIRFLTPTILTNKVMLPPPLMDKARKVPNRHRLLPTPSYIFNFLIKLWNTLVPDELKLPKPGSDLWGAYRFGRVSDIVINEVDFRVKAVTAICGKDAAGRLREIRGFVGWVLYELSYPHPKLKRVYSKLLALANHLGIGRSRAIGFGHVTITKADRPK